MSDFFRFPHTPHLAWLGEGTPRDDKVLSPTEARSLLASEVVVEEKLDGANLGVSLGIDGEPRLQNRGQYLVPPFAGQFSRAAGWLGEHAATLEAALRPGQILFGEWMAARHTVGYSALPNWFIAFDVYDGTAGRFWNTSRRDALARAIGLPIAPTVARGRFGLKALTNLVATAPGRFSPALEGLIIRREGPDFLEARAKLVRTDFTQAIGEHWRGRRLEWNAMTPS